MNGTVGQAKTRGAIRTENDHDRRIVAIVPNPSQTTWHVRRPGGGWRRRAPAAARDRL